MSRGKIELEWESYKSLLLTPIHATETQIKETRKAFYAGAEAYYRTVMTCLSLGLEPKQSDENLMETLHDELQQFALDVKNGKK